MVARCNSGLHQQWPTSLDLDYDYLNVFYIHTH